MSTQPSMPSVRPIQVLAKEALDVQDACNLSGVVHSFSRVITQLRETLTAEGKFSTDKLNAHPICVLYSSKIASLTGSESMVEFSRAYEWAKDITHT